MKKGQKIGSKLEREQKLKSSQLMQTSPSTMIVKPTKKPDAQIAPPGGLVKRGRGRPRKIDTIPPITDKSSNNSPITPQKGKTQPKVKRQKRILNAPRVLKPDEPTTIPDSPTPATIETQDIDTTAGLYRNQTVWWEPEIEQRPSWWVAKGRQFEAGNIISINYETNTALVSFHPYHTPYIDVKVLVPLAELRPRHLPSRGM
jgi:hypothetical protein